MLYSDATRAIRFLSIVILLFGSPDSGWANGDTLEFTKASADTTLNDSTARRFGFVTLSTNLANFIVVLDEVYSSPIYAVNNDTLRVPVGKHRILITSDRTLDYESDHEISPDTIVSISIGFDTSRSTTQLRRLSSYARIVRKGTLEVVTDEDSDILLNREFMGRGYAIIDAPAGPHLLVTRHPGLGEKEQTVIAKKNRLARIELYNRPTKMFMLTSCLVPGLNQFHKNENVKGVAILLLSAGSLGAGYAYGNVFKEKNDAYSKSLDAYEKATTETDAARLGSEVSDRYDAVLKTSRIRNGFFLIAAAVFVYNVIDAFSEPEYGYRKPREIPFAVSWESGDQFRLSLAITSPF